MIETLPSQFFAISLYSADVAIFSFHASSHSCVIALYAAMFPSLLY